MDQSPTRPAGESGRSQKPILRSGRSVVGVATFRRLCFAQFTTMSAVYGLSLAGAALVEEQTQSSAQTGLVILSSILPAFLGSLIAGAVVDRWGRARVLRASHLARGLVGLAFWLGARALPPPFDLLPVYAASAAAAAFTQFAAPAELALLPDLVGLPLLMAANGVLQLNMLAAEAVGVVGLSPLVVKLFGPPAVGLMVAVLCLAGLLAVLTLPGGPSGGEPAGGRRLSALWPDLRAGWETIARDRILRLVAMQATVAATLLLVLLSLLPGLLSRHLGLSVEDAPALILPGGVGFVLGAALVGRCARRRPEKSSGWIAIGLIGLGFALGVLAWIVGAGGRWWHTLPVILGVGLAMALVVIPARATLQSRAPADRRGRVISAQLALANAAAVLPLLLGGGLADAIGILPVIVVLGATAVAAGLAGLRAARRRT